MDVLKSLGNAFGPLQPIFLNGPQAPFPPASASSESNEADVLLVPKGRNLGKHFSISDFCEHYGLSSKIADRLHDNEFTDTDAFKLVTVGNLKEMEFKLGAIASSLIYIVLARKLS